MTDSISHRWDMHCHTLFSDGQLSPYELCQQALAADIQDLVITDHDTAAGYRSLVAGQPPSGVRLWPGAELSSVWLKRSIHVVGIGMDVHSDAWQAVEERYRHCREQRLSRLFFVLRREGLTLDEDRVRTLAGEGTLGRPHLARYLAETGQVRDTAHAFKRWLGAGKVGDVKQNWPAMAEAVDDIRRCGGVAVLAHPHRYKLTWRKLDELLSDFQEAGGRAVEVSCPGMPPQLRQRLVERCVDSDLMIGGGSDFHVPDRPWCRLGRFPQWPHQGEILSRALESGRCRVLSPAAQC